MTSDDAGPAAAPGAVLEKLRRLVAAAERSGEWPLAALALQRGLEGEATRIGAFAIIARVVMQRLFVEKLPQERVHAFLVDELSVAPDKAGIVIRMAADAAKKAVDVAEGRNTLDGVLDDLARDHDADRPLARALVETGVEFLGSSASAAAASPWLLLSIATNPVVALPAALVLGAIVKFGFGASWARAAAIAFTAFLVAFAVCVYAAWRSRRAPRR